MPPPGLAPECPSWGNIVTGNVFDGGWPMCDALQAVDLWQGDEADGCPPPEAGMQRYEAFDNTVATTTACVPGLDEMQRP